MRNGIQARPTRPVGTGDHTQVTGTNKTIDGEDKHLLDVAHHIPTSQAITGPPTIFNVTVTSANSEESQALPIGTKKFEIKVRDNTEMRLGFITGAPAVGGNYITMPSGSIFWEDDSRMSLTGVSLFFETKEAGQIVEILAWT